MIDSCNLLCVLFDAGETNGLKPLFQDFEIKGIDFKIIVMATAEHILEKDVFLYKRITLLDLGIQEIVNDKTSREKELSSESLSKLKPLNPKTILVGTASRIQAQVLTLFPAANKIAFVDNFDYDIKFTSFKTVKKVQKVANHVLCPSAHVKNLLIPFKGDKSTFHIVGKPSLEAWEKEIAFVSKQDVLKRLSFSQTCEKIVTIIGGYGEGYDLINPLFDDAKKKLKEECIQVIFQPHPKVAAPLIKTTEALAIADFVVGYNSSVIFEAALVGKEAIYFIPDKTPFDHFAIKENLVPKVNSIEQLLDYILREHKTYRIREKLQIPKNSIECISKIVLN